jgi:PAS domain S-box-containing protein
VKNWKNEGWDGAAVATRMPSMSEPFGYVLEPLREGPGFILFCGRGRWFSRPRWRDVFHSPPHLCHLAMSLTLFLFVVPSTVAEGAQANQPPITRRAAPQARVDPPLVTLPMLDGKDIRFTPLSTARGLSQTKVSQVVQDNQGFVWFGTRYGLNRYDGYNFKIFVHEPGNLNSLSGVVVNALFKDRAGALWIGCDQFLNKLDPVTETFTRYPVPFVTHISQDTGRTLWLATPTGGLYSLDPATGRLSHYSHDPNNPSSLNSDHVIYSGEDKGGRFWVAIPGCLEEFDRSTGKVTRHISMPDAPLGFAFYEDRFGLFWIYHVSPNALAVFDRKTNTLTHYAFSDRGASGTAETRVTAMIEDRSGTLWVATHGPGLLKFDREHGRFIRYRNDPADPDSLPQNEVDTLFADREGSIWAGLGSMGPVRFATNRLPFTKLVYSPHPNRKNPFVGAIYEDRRGILWVGTPEALNRIDRKEESFSSYRNGGPETSTDVITIREDRSGNLWVGTFGHGLLCFDRRTGQFKEYRHNPADPFSLSNDVVTRLLIDHNGTLWAGTQDGLNRFDAATERFTTYKLNPNRNLYSRYLEVVEDRGGMLWLGTDSSGLQRFDPARRQFTVYEREMNRPGTLSDNRVNSVHFDSSGTMWVGTQNGLNKLDPTTGKFTAYTQGDGLPGNAVSCVLEGDHGDLWMSTNNGVARFDPQRNTFKSYSTVDGLPGPDLTGWGACFKSAAGEMFFGGFSGATAFFPDKVIDSAYVPPIVLTDFRLFGTGAASESASPLKKTINYTNAITLSHRQNIFSIAFSALSYFNPTTNRYRYRLEGLDSEWHEVGSEERLVNYTALPRGFYAFRVQGATSRGPWSEPGIALRIKVLPPWWSTWWFRAAYATLLLLLIWSAYRYRVGQMARQYATLQRSEDRLRLVIDTIPTMAWSALPDGSVDFASQSWLGYTGFSMEDWLGTGWRTIAHPEDLNTAVEKWREALATGEPYECELRIRTAHGSHRWCLSRAVPLRDELGKIVKWYGTNTDIDDRKQAEEVLRESEKSVRLIVDGIAGLVAIMTPEGYVEFVNNQALEYFGKTLEELKGWATSEAVHPDDLPQAVAAWRHSVETGDPYAVDHRLRRADGVYRWFHSRGLSLRDARGRILRWYNLLTDIDERRRAEEKLQNENVALREEIDKALMFEEIVGTSAPLQTVLSRISKVAPTDSSVLITGETGTGKELVARAIHRRSRRSSRTFVSVNCAAIPRGLIAPELFGHEKGAFTGATQRRLGRFELAEGGTIFLDEIGELSAETQVALLRVLQEHEFQRVGGTASIRTNVRVIAATNRDLEAAIAAGAFRRDLFYRLNVFPIEVPPLRERRDDIPLLVGYFIERYARKDGKRFQAVNKRSLDLLQSYPWPGNIRELQNVIERSSIVSSGDILSVDESWLSKESSQPLSQAPVVRPTEGESRGEREIIEAALAESRGRVYGPLGAAAKLGIPRSTLESRIKALNISKARFKFG